MSNNNRYMREYMKQRYRKLRSYWVTKLGGKCGCCKAGEQLEFDHIDRNSKTIEVERIWSVSNIKREEEMEKLQLLCRSCHIKKTRRDLGQKDARKVHGTLSSYRYCRCAKCKKAKRDYARKYRAGNLMVK